MAASDPWMKFYPQDWRADEKLRMCSLGARGLWIEMLALMHRSERYGQLLISGRVPTDAQLAVQVGALPDQVTSLLAELEEAGVFSRAASGAIYSRRMTRDHKKAENARKNGRKGGNPNLSSSYGKQKGKTSWDNQQDNREDKGGDKPQKPEARNQNKKIPKKDDGEIDRPDGVTEQVWRDFLDLRKRKKANLTETALAGIVREAGNAGWPLQSALEECLVRGWQAFKAEWVTDHKHQETPRGGHSAGGQRQSGSQPGSFLDFLIEQDRERAEWARQQGEKGNG